MNICITLYVIKNKENKKYYLVYGFGINSDEETMDDWKINNIDRKLKLYKLTSNLNLTSYNKLINSFYNYHIEGYILERNFIERENVISGISYNFEKNKPTDKLSDLKEYWNINKVKLLEDIKKNYSDLVVDKRIKELLNILYKKTAINFKYQPYRFGNLEIYKFRKYNDIFKFDFQENNKVFKLYIDKPFKSDIYIKLYSENNNRPIINKLKILEKGDTDIIFNMIEDTFHVMLEIWDQSGKLIYFNNLYYIKSISSKGNLVGTTYRVSDKWSRSLKESTNHCLDNIEEVTPVNTSINSNIDLCYEFDHIYKTIKDTSQLFESYKKNIAKGKFIRNTPDRSGEIDSYKIVKDLIDSDNINKVIIIDPYFSIEAVFKILPRVENKNLKIKIITSLTEKDSDTGKKSENYKERFKNKILNNINVIHKNLKVINILSGKNEAFHDRYIIRFLNNGFIEGYILGNSINSMGQRYPFIVSPLEEEILKEVFIYIEELLGNRSSKESYYNNLTREVIYDVKEKSANDKKIREYRLPNILAKVENKKEALKICLEKEYILSNRGLDINDEKYKEITDLILLEWKRDKTDVIIGIGELLYNSILYNKILRYILEVGNINKKDFINELKAHTKEIEENVDISSYRNDKIEKKLYLILNGKASANIKYIYNNPNNIFYGSYLKCLYKLLWKYSFKEYIELLEKVKSPMMFSELILYLNSLKFNLDMYKILIKSEIPYIEDLTAYWLINSYIKKQINIDELIETIKSFDDYNKLNQGCIILSELIFQYRLYNKVNKRDILAFIEKLVMFFNESSEKLENQIKYIEKFKDIELENEIKFKMIVLEGLKNKALGDYIKLELLNRFIKYYKNQYTQFCLENDRNLISYFIKIIKMSDDSFLEKFFDKSKTGRAFIQIREPLLKEIDFKSWNKLKIICSWEYNILLSLEDSGYDISVYKDLLETMELEFL